MSSPDVLVRQRLGNRGGGGIYDTDGVGPVAFPGDGSADERPGFNTLQTVTMPAGKGRLRVGVGTHRIDSNLTISQELEFPRGAVLKPAAGVTITLQVAPKAGHHQIFDLSLGGTVVCDPTYDSFVRVDWWGYSATDASVTRAAVNSAITAMAGASSGGTVRMAGKVYLVNQAGASAWAILGASNVTLKSNGHGGPRLANDQDKFCRIISATGATNFQIRDLVIDGNAAGNDPGVDPNAKEQQHAVFLNGCTDSLLRNVRIKNTRGDCLYWFGGCSRPRAKHCDFSGSYRVHIHAQWLTNGDIDGCHFWNSVGNNHVKSELDNEGNTSRGITISGGSMEGDADSVGVGMGGLSASTPYQLIVVRGVLFRGLGTAIVLGIFSRGWSISGCVVDGCKRGIVVASYSEVYGYSALQDVSITGNTMRNLTGAGVDDWAIQVANCTGVVITGNRLSGTTLKRGIGISHCDEVVIGTNGFHTDSADGIGLSLYRCKTVDVTRLQLSLPAGGSSSSGVGVGDDATYTSIAIDLANIRVIGPVQNAVSVQDLSANGALSISRLRAPNAVNKVFGASAARMAPSPEVGIWTTREFAVLSSIAAAPQFVGQIAVVGTLVYIAAGTASAADWKQLN